MSLARLVAAVLDVRASADAIRAVPWFVRSWRAYARLPGAERLRLRDAYPQLRDRGATTPYDPHYFHQAVWTLKRILARAPERHVDVGSDVNFVGMVSAVVPVTFVDIRPLPVDLPSLEIQEGDVSQLPFADGSVHSLSSLHVIEHVGLGRYGDALDPRGSARACEELARVLAPEGDLYVSVPVGVPRTCFNAHRVHDPREIVGYFDSLELVSFAVVDDEYRRFDDADLERTAALRYGCGLFHFRRRE